MARAQEFEATSASWTTEVSDRTGSVAAISIVDNPGAWTDLAADSVALRNLSPTVVEIAWKGAACTDCAHFDLTPSDGDGLELRYDLGSPPDRCVIRPDTILVYALDIRFIAPVDVARITAVPSCGP